MRLKHFLYITIAAIMMSTCGYQGGYRYECQDPENWESAECNPPICEVDGTCTKNLIGFDPNSTEVQE